jgi:putative IMPACT (imprinted ancient) family translation regulator
LGLALPVLSEQEIGAKLAAQAREYHDATHHCYAAVWNFGKSVQSSDAGEPHGTAGLPILRAIQSAGLCDALVIVTRYFGGTKLGKGNLARAYAACAEEALSAAPKKTVCRKRKFLIEIPPSETGKLYRLTHRNRWDIVTVSSGESGRFEVRVPMSEGESALQAVRNATSGRVTIKEDGIWTSS